MFLDNQKMKTRILIIIGIAALGFVVSFVMIETYHGQIEWKEKVGGLKDISSISSVQEFLEMDCEDLNHIFQEFPSVEVADAWNTRMHECINEKESLLSKTTEPRREKGIVAEMEDLQQMSCDDIIQRNTEGEYQSKDNRMFVREKVLDCSDTEEFFAINASCEELYERYHSGQEYWFEEHKQQTEHRLAKCNGM